METGTSQIQVSLIMLIWKSLLPQLVYVVEVDAVDGAETVATGVTNATLTAKAAMGSQIV